jgi:hypothetical protein
MVKAFSIEPDLIYDDGPLVLDLGMSGGALAKARRSGALRYTRKGGRVLYLGRWILDWLEKDEVGARTELEVAR